LAFQSAAPRPKRARRLPLGGVSRIPFSPTPSGASRELSALPREVQPYPRVVRLGPLEWIGVPLLALLPVLALLGVLGPSNAEQAVAVPASDLLVELSYPSRLRHKGDGEMRVLVHNTGSAPRRGLLLGLDQNYLERFGRVQSLPPSQSMVSGALRIALPPLAGGESASVRLMLEAGDWGRLPGWIELGDERGTALTRMEFRTLVLP
jgi:hypothetical protein